jgi:hypothetical protein
MPLGLSSLVMTILLNFQHITRYYEKNRNQKFPLENLLQIGHHGLCYILQVSAQKGDFWLRYGIPQKWIVLRGFLRKTIGF